MSSRYVQLDPVFDVQDWDAMRPLLEEGFDKVQQNEPHTHSYVFAESDNQEFLAVNEVYPNGQAVVEHLQNVNEILGRALAGPCKVHKFYASGPAQELEIIKPLLDPLGSITYFESIEVEGGGVSHVSNIREFASSKDDESPVESFVILPVFKVNDWDKLHAQFVDPLLEVARNEEGCVYFSFARNANENLLLVREKYVNVEAALQHLEKAAPILASCMSEGLLELTEAAVYGTSKAIDASRPAFDPFGTQYRTILHALDRFQVSP